MKQDGRNKARLITLSPRSIFDHLNLAVNAFGCRVAILSAVPPEFRKALFDGPSAPELLNCRRSSPNPRRSLRSIRAVDRSHAYFVPFKAVRPASGRVSSLGASKLVVRQ